MKPQTFEEYLAEQFMKEYHGDKDHYEDAYDNWLSDLEVDTIIQLAQQWGDILTF